MSTRGIVARAVGDGWAGRYMHSDNYPSGAGQTLHHIYQDVFNYDAEAMLKVLIDDHPAGWSTINTADWSQAPGFIEYDLNGPRFGSPEWKTYVNTPKRPQCYCHGDRSEDHDDLRTSEKARESPHQYEEYLYVIAPKIGIMEVYDTHGVYSVEDPAEYRPTLMATINLDDPLYSRDWWEALDRSLDEE